MPPLVIRPRLASPFAIATVASLALLGCVEDAPDPADDGLADLDAAATDGAAQPGAAARIVDAACPSLPPIASRTAPVRGTSTPGLPLAYPACQTPVAIRLRSRSCNP